MAEVEKPNRPLEPGATIGILGGGQLARMLIVAAAQLGLRTHVYSDESGPACDVATQSTVADYRDRAAIEAFAAGVDVVTYEFENVPVDVAGQLADMLPVRPGSLALAVAQDRLSEKSFISGLGIPVAPFAPVGNATDLDEAMARIAAPAILKTRRMGYDGKGQVSLKPGEDAAAAIEALAPGRSEVAAIFEKRVTFEREISVLAVRGLDGALAYYDCPQNTHENGILRRSMVPSGLPAGDIAEAQQIAGQIAEALDYVGVLAVELFDLGAGASPRFMVNEIAPRVHNSGHWTLDACAVSQFENHIRAVAGWPLGATQRHSDAIMENIIGPEADNWPALAAEPGICLHLYGKHVARPGRKMGHLTRLKLKSAC